ncbi:acyl-CoA thioesterase II [Cryobacterium sp. BB307]|uniref:acyl-CoA thioesterase n=1 Tax=Cryobacterium sp. BB307 TaxID=2716317 RepID=UPI001447099B|nr:acyl-CoA thioesterase II [Cryobacterium sp. BB307]
MNDPLFGMLAALDLDDTGAPAGKDIFTGPSQWMPHGRVYGGQVLAQSLVAAVRTVPEDRIVHSLHGYFLRPGDVQLPITFTVDRIHDGRSFSTRRSQAYQSGLPILSMIASFQTVDEGLDHQVDVDGNVPPPESLPTDEEVLDGHDHVIARYWAKGRPFDMRHVQEPIYLEPDRDSSPQQAIWLRATGDLPDDPNLHRAALAYASDYPILESVLRRHSLAWATPGLKVASLDHAMWFHRFARVDEWLLYVQESPSATGGRGLSHGRFYTREGVLVASVAQEGMIRIPSPR